MTCAAKKNLKDEIARLLRDPKYGSSDRHRDRMRTKLKKMGMIRFDRDAWQWFVSPSGVRFMHDND